MQLIISPEQNYTALHQENVAATMKRTNIRMKVLHIMGGPGDLFKKNWMIAC
jgi:hypothetical protein